MSGIIEVNAQGKLPADFHSQAENLLVTLEAIVGAAGATMGDVVSLNSYHVGGLPSQLAELAKVKAGRFGVPRYPTWTGVGVAQLGVPGALLETSATVMACD